MNHHELLDASWMTPVLNELSIIQTPQDVDRFLNHTWPLIQERSVQAQTHLPVELHPTFCREQLLPLFEHLIRLTPWNIGSPAQHMLVFWHQRMWGLWRGPQMKLELYGWLFQEHPQHLQWIQSLLTLYPGIYKQWVMTWVEHACCMKERWVFEEKELHPLDWVLIHWMTPGRSGTGNQEQLLVHQRELMSQESLEAPDFILHGCLFELTEHLTPGHRAVFAQHVTRLIPRLSRACLQQWSMRLACWLHPHEPQALCPHDVSQWLMKLMQEHPNLYTATTDEGMPEHDVSAAGSMTLGLRGIGQQERLFLSFVMAPYAHAKAFSQVTPSKGMFHSWLIHEHTLFLKRWLPYQPAHLHRVLMAFLAVHHTPLFEVLWPIVQSPAQLMNTSWLEQLQVKHPQLLEEKHWTTAKDYVLLKQESIRLHQIVTEHTFLREDADLKRKRL